MIRIKDIAKEAGVSPTTVSNVIHGNTRKVSGETIEKVQKLLEEYEYVPNMSAQGLAGSNSHIIGILIGGRSVNRGLEHSMFFSTIVQELEYQLYQRNYYMMPHYVETTEESLKFAATWAVEGLITIGIGSAENLEINEKCRVPLVSIDVYYDEGNAVPNVGTDDCEGGYIMGKFLLERGHRHLAFLADNDVGVDHMRWLGFVKACEEAGYSADDMGHILIPANRKERRADSHSSLIKLAGKYDALFFASDFYAVEALNMLTRMGISVPEDVSVAGFDDSDLALLASPELTTIHQSIREKAVRAVEKLFCYMREDQNVLPDEKLKVSLVVRDSVR